MEEGDGSIVMVLGNRNTNTDGRIVKIQNRPESLELRLEGLAHGMKRASNEKIVDINSGDDSAGFGHMVVNTGVGCQAFEAPGEHCLAHCLVPDMTTLFHAVEAVLELPYPVFLSRFSKTKRLLQVNSFICREEAIEVSGLDIDLLDFPVVDCGNMYIEGGGGTPYRQWETSS